MKMSPAAIDLDEMFEGASVPSWFQSFADEPAKAIGDLLVGRADVGLLTAEEPDTLLLDWLDGFGERGGFVIAVDQALTWWIVNSWSKSLLERAGGSRSLTAVVWCRVANVISMDKRLDHSAARLRREVLAGWGFLADLNQGRSRDPLGRAWLAIARHQHDWSLADQWWRLCSLPPDEPWYRGGYGIHGLRSLPQRVNRSQSTVAQGLVVLGEALNDRVLNHEIDKMTAVREFLIDARMVTAAYPFPNKWDAFWCGVIKARNLAIGGWVAELTDKKMVTISSKPPITEEELLYGMDQAIRTEDPTIVEILYPEGTIPDMVDEYLGLEIGDTECSIDEKLWASIEDVCIAIGQVAVRMSDGKIYRVNVHPAIHEMDEQEVEELIA